MHAAAAIGWRSPLASNSLAGIKPDETPKVIAPQKERASEVPRGPGTGLGEFLLPPYRPAA
jgi:hypothetical protein